MLSPNNPGAEPKAQALACECTVGFRFGASGPFWGAYNKDPTT